MIFSMNTKFVFHVFLFLLLHLTSCHHTLVLKLVLGVEMVDKFFSQCTFCSFTGIFGVVDIIGQHVKGVTHVLAKKNKASIGTIGNQMTLQDSFTKGFLVGKVEYHVNFVKTLLGLLHKLSGLPRVGC